MLPCYAVQGQHEHLSSKTSISALTNQSRRNPAEVFRSVFAHWQRRKPKDGAQHVLGVFLPFSSENTSDVRVASGERRRRKRSERGTSHAKGEKHKSEVMK
jgi:hypothetical protein